MIKNVVCKVLGAKNALRNASANNVDELTFLQLWHKLAFESIFEKKTKATSTFFYRLAGQQNVIIFSIHSTYYLPQNICFFHQIPFNPATSHSIPWIIPRNLTIPSGRRPGGSALRPKMSPTTPSTRPPKGRATKVTEKPNQVDTAEPWKKWPQLGKIHGLFTGYDGYD